MSWTRKLREVFAANSADASKADASATDALTLEGLSDINWAELQHAYGSAKDVPGQLRALASRDRERGEKALHEFYGNIWHQGTTYQATRYAVPFLRQILADELSPVRAEIMELLVSLAFGHSYHDVHQHMGIYEERDEPEFQAQIARELNDVEAAHQAVRAGVAQYLELWQSDELRVRAIYLASLFGKFNPEVAAARREKLESETDDATRAALWMGWFYVAPSDEDSASTQDAFRDGQAQKSAWTLEHWALSALVLRLKSAESERDAAARDAAARDAAARVLLDSLEENEARQRSFGQLPHFEEGLGAASLGQLLALGTAARRYTPAFVALLRRANNEFAALELIESLCPLYFGDFSREAPVSWAKLEGAQRAVARALAETDGVWGDEKIIFGNLSQQLRYFGLPDRRAGMRALVAESGEIKS